nr:aldo-keto reductase family 1 member C1 homolog [Cavia porcellus]
MSSKQQCVNLNDGHVIPVLGFGTYAPEEVPKSMATVATKLAIDAGFRHIDSAYLYKNEEEVGLAIRSKIADGTIKREDIFYTTKLLFQPGEDLLPTDEHGKLTLDMVDLCATWEVMEKCKDLGLAKSIGVSNFNRRQLEMILNKPGLKYKPVCNQVSTLNFMFLSASCSFSSATASYFNISSFPSRVDQSFPVLLKDPVLCAMAKKYKQTPALIALRYQLQRGIVVLAKSFNEKRIKENMQVFEFQLTSEDMKTLDGLNKNIRYVAFNMAKAHPNYPFFDEY